MSHDIFFVFKKSLMPRTNSLIAKMKCGYLPQKNVTNLKIGLSLVLLRLFNKLNNKLGYLVMPNNFYASLGYHQGLSAFITLQISLVFSLQLLKIIAFISGKCRHSDRRKTKRL